MTTDFHAHWLPQELARALAERRTAPFIETGRDGETFHMPVGAIPFDAEFSDLEARLRFMDRHDIARQVLSLPCLFGLDGLPVEEAAPLLDLFNDATARAVRQWPDRFSGLASLPFDDMQRAASDYRRARAAGLLGAIVPINYFASIGHMDALAPLLQAAEEAGGHLFLHPGLRAEEAAVVDATPYPDSVMPRRQLDIQHKVAEAMATLLWGDFLTKYTGFTLHVANMGGTLPLVVERMDQTSKLRTHEAVLPSERVRNAPLLVDCSSMGPIAITAAVACFGADSVLFGSDHPIYRSDWTLEAVQQADISDAARQAILVDNAERVLARWR